MRAPCTIAMPMPPAPTTSTVAPSGSTFAVFSTAPTPVCTAQPITHAISSGVSSATLTAPDSGVIDVLGETAEADAAEHRLALARQRRATVDERCRS